MGAICVHGPGVLGMPFVAERLADRRVVCEFVVFALLGNVIRKTLAGV